MSEARGESPKSRRVSYALRSPRSFWPSFLFLKNFIYLWLCWVFVSVRGLSLVAASGGHSSSRCAGLSLSQPLFLRSTGSRRAGSAAVAHGPSCSVACGIFPGQGSNPCPLHRQADSQPLSHQGSPGLHFFAHAVPLTSNSLSSSCSCPLKKAHSVLRASSVPHAAVNQAPQLQGLLH